MMNNNTAQSAIRVRMAPSPTGYLHIGGLRTTLFNLLFAKHMQGKFLIRIEDTDVERSKPEYTQSILDAFTWCSIEADEPIVIQSERFARHAEVIEKLLQEGKAYRCYCTPDELRNRLGMSAADDGGYAQYDGRCKAIPVKNDPCAIRFAVPADKKEVSFHDLIRGDITFQTDQLDDFIIMRSDGTPMYNFVVVVDDADMRISHVIRGDDHISNTPKQILLYEACGFAIPQFAHLPMILGEDGKRLSKRHAATAVFDYKKQGFLADALCNYLVRLGWSHGDQEIFTRAELIEYFALDQVGKKAAIFDTKKLEWMNGLYMRQLSAEQLLELISKDIDSSYAGQLSNWTEKQLRFAIELYKERTVTLIDLMNQVKKVYEQQAEYLEAEIAPYTNEQTHGYMKKLQEVLALQEQFTHEELAVVIKKFCSNLGISLAVIGKPLRIALTGKTSSPGIFELLELLGKKESIARLQHFSDAIA